MKEEKKLLGFYDYTVILTYIGALLGVFGISFAIRNHFNNAIVCLMSAGACDMFDGTIANTKIRTEREKRFGIQIDSFSDIICFGILPGLFVYKICKESFVALIASSLYILCALIRLAYFNVCEEERQSTEDGCRKYFSGLPVTSSALYLPFFYLITDKNIILIFVLMLAGILYLTPFRLKKPQFIGKVAIAVTGIAVFSLLIRGVLHGL